MIERSIEALLVGLSCFNSSHPTNPAIELGKTSEESVSFEDKTL